MLISEEFIGNDPFVMYLGDNLLNRGIVEFVEQFVKEKPAAQILLTPVPDPQMFGVAELEGDKVRAAGREAEGAEVEPGAGRRLHVRARRSSRRSSSIKPSFRNELEITDAIQDLIDRGLRVTPHLVSGWWKDTGKLEDMLEANRLILETLTPRIEGKVDAASRIEGNVVIEAGATVENSVIRGPAVIGPGARIIDAYVGPFTSIGKDVEIQQVGDRAQHRARRVADSRSRDARRRQPDRPRREDSSPAAQAGRAPLHARRQLRGVDQVVSHR